MNWILMCYVWIGHKNFRMKYLEEAYVKTTHWFFCVFVVFVVFVQIWCLCCFLVFYSLIVIIHNWIILAKIYHRTLVKFYIDLCWNAFCMYCNFAIIWPMFVLFVWFVCFVVVLYKQDGENLQVSLERLFKKLLWCDNVSLGVLFA